MANERGEELETIPQNAAHEPRDDWEPLF